MSALLLLVAITLMGVAVVGSFVSGAKRGGWGLYGYWFLGWFAVTLAFVAGTL